MFSSEKAQGFENTPFDSTQINGQSVLTRKIGRIKNFKFEYKIVVQSDFNQNS